MADVSAEYSKAVDELHVSFQALQRAGSLLEGRPKAEAGQHLRALEAHIARFLERTWTPRVLIEIAQLYMDVATVVKWSLESGMKDILAMLKMPGPERLFVS